MFCSKTYDVCGFSDQWHLQNRGFPHNHFNDYSIYIYIFFIVINFLLVESTNWREIFQIPVADFTPMLSMHLSRFVKWLASSSEAWNPSASPRQPCNVWPRGTWASPIRVCATVHLQTLATMAQDQEGQCVTQQLLKPDCSLRKDSAWKLPLQQLGNSSSSSWGTCSCPILGWFKLVSFLLSHLVGSRTLGVRLDKMFHYQHLTPEQVVGMRDS